MVFTEIGDYLMPRSHLLVVTDMNRVAVEGGWSASM